MANSSSFNSGLRADDQRPVRPPAAGFNLLEMMVAMALATLLSGSFLTLVWQFQKWNTNLHLLLERDENLRQTPLLFPRWLAASENREWQGDADQLRVRPGGLTSQADIDGPEGFPDGELGSPFEAISIEALQGNLTLQSGAGSRQPVLLSIERFEATLEGSTLRLEVQAAASRALWEGAEPIRRTATVTVPLWNRRCNLFGERP